MLSYESTAPPTTYDDEQQRNQWNSKLRNTQLILAVLEPNQGDVLRLLNSGVSPMVRCQHSMATVCHLAAARGEEQILRELIQKSPAGGENQPLRARDLHGRQPHHVAAAFGQLNILKIILQSDPKLIDSRVEIVSLEDIVKEDTLDSIFHDHFEVTNMLPSIRSGSTVLHVACRYSQRDIVHFLLKNGATVNIEDDDKLFPMDVVGLDLVGPTGFDKEEDLQLMPLSNPIFLLPAEVHDILEEQEANAPLSENIMAMLREGRGKFHINQNTMLTISIHRFVLQRDMASIKHYLESGGSIRVQDNEGLTPIYLAVMRGLEEPLRLLLSWDGEAVNATDRQGMTPLHLAVQLENEKIIEILLSEKVDLRIQTKNGETVLHIAAMKINNKIMKALLDRTSVAEALGKKDRKHHTPLQIAVKYENEGVVKLLLEKCLETIICVENTIRLIELAVVSKNLNVLKSLLMNPKIEEIFFKSASNDILRPLKMAIIMDSIQSFNFLIDKLKNKLENKEKSIRENQLSSLLLCAAQNGRLKVIKMILGGLEKDQACNLVSLPNLKGRVPLILAAMNGHADCTMLLLKYGANLAARDSCSDLTAIDHIYYNIPNSVKIFDDLMDEFMEVKDPNEREDSRKFKISMHYEFLLADKKNGGRQLGVVEAFIKSRHDGLRKTFFLHPLTESFLFFKWKELQLFYLLFLFMFLLHLIALTSHSLCTNVYKDFYLCSHIYIWIYRIIVLILLIPIIIIEVMTFRRDATFLKDSEGWVKWFVVFFSAASVIPSPWSRPLAAVSVLVSWLHLLFLVARFQKWGLHVLMFLEVATNVWQVVSKFGFLLFGFAFSFLILFNNEHPYEGMGETMSKVVVMIVELDYAGSFGAVGPEQTDKRQAINIVGRILYLGFVIFVVMILNNLINGLCVSDVAELEKQGRSRHLEKQASFLVAFEKMCYKMKQKNDEESQSLIDSIIVYPNDKRNRKSNPFSRNLRLRILLAVHHRDEQSDLQKIENIAEDVRNLSQVVKEIKEALQD